MQQVSNPALASSLGANLTHWLAHRQHHRTSDLHSCVCTRLRSGQSYDSRHVLRSQSRHDRHLSRRKSYLPHTLSLPPISHPHASRHSTCAGTVNETLQAPPQKASLRSSSSATRRRRKFRAIVILTRGEVLCWSGDVAMICILYHDLSRNSRVLLT